MKSGAGPTGNECGNDKKDGDQIAEAREKDHCSNPCLVCETTFHHIAEGRAVASADSTARSLPHRRPSPHSAWPLRQDSASHAGQIAPKAPCPRALMPRSSVCRHSMVVRLE